MTNTIYHNRKILKKILHICMIQNIVRWECISFFLFLFIHCFRLSDFQLLFDSRVYCLHLLSIFVYRIQARKICIFVLVFFYLGIFSVEPGTVFGFGCWKVFGIFYCVDNKCKLIIAGNTQRTVLSIITKNKVCVCVCFVF